MRGPFICLTPNPAIDRRLELSAPLKERGLNRVARVREGAGGKGMNVARTLAALGAQVQVAGFLAGLNGDRFRTMLKDDALQGVFIEGQGETRECHIVIDGEGQPTEINEPGPSVTPREWRSLMEALPSGQLIVSGSLPPGSTPAGFTRALRLLVERNGEAPVVDASGAHLAAALEAGVRLIKPNEHEIESVSRPGRSAIATAKEIWEERGTRVLLTLGAAGAIYVGEEAWRVAAPRVPAVNPVASGDCLLAAFVWAQSAGWSLPEALRLGVAAGAANTRLGGGARLTRDQIFEQLEDVPKAEELAGL